MNNKITDNLTNQPDETNNIITNLNTLNNELNNLYTQLQQMTINTNNNLNLNQQLANLDGNTLCQNILNLMQNNIGPNNIQLIQLTQQFNSLPNNDILICNITNDIDLRKKLEQHLPEYYKLSNNQFKKYFKTHHVNIAADAYDVIRNNYNMSIQYFAIQSLTFKKIYTYPIPLPQNTWHINFEFIGTPPILIYMMLERTPGIIEFFQTRSTDPKSIHHPYVFKSLPLWRYKVHNKTIAPWLAQLPYIEDLQIPTNVKLYILNKSPTDKMIFKRYVLYQLPNNDYYNLTNVDEPNYLQYPHKQFDAINYDSKGVLSKGFIAEVHFIHNQS